MTANKTDRRSTPMVKYTPSYLKIIFLLLVGTAFLLGGALTQAADSKIAAPDWQLSDVDGKPVRLSDFKGKVVILDFWATWCPPCREEIPGLIRVQQKLAANGLQVVGIAVDSVDKSRQAAAEMAISYPVLVAEVQIIDVTRRLGNRAGGLPFTVVLDREGRLVTTHLGLLSEAQLERLVTPLLG